MMLEKLEFCPRCKREDLSQAEYDHQFCVSCDMPIGQIGAVLQREREAAVKPLPPELDLITDVVLAYHPKPKSKAAKKRARKKKRDAKKG